MNDPVWTQLREEAAIAAAREPVLNELIRTTVLECPSLEASLAQRLARKLGQHAVSAGYLSEQFVEILTADPTIGEQVRADMRAIVTRDPASRGYLSPLLYFKGFHALSTHRLAHHLWKTNREDLALYLQSISSQVFAVDIHPAARVGAGILLDHATSIVIGETAVVEDNVSMLHEVTLGGTGKERGDRHPKVRCGVLIGAGAKILGNIEIGVGAKIGAGSVVLAPVPPHTTVAGVPARVVGKTGEDNPSECMEHKLGDHLDAQWPFLDPGI